MESFYLAFYFIVYIALVVFYIRFMMYICEKIGLYNFLNSFLKLIKNYFFIGKIYK